MLKYSLVIVTKRKESMVFGPTEHYFHGDVLASKLLPEIYADKLLRNSQIGLKLLLTYTFPLQKGSKGN
ncbi:hypothetical protein AQUCO_00901043v1 [Aquilegia coerulea]|uniref:Uncharacterized protein n=1 Tax=Aquilegia coerulea TaxID=218851 RepID=A0A2G5EGI5_AQUCA|nr:hypothetical protein AQUCO_00901043v1 [Aquilegia coerulea]